MKKSKKSIKNSNTSDKSTNPKNKEANNKSKYNFGSLIVTSVSSLGVFASSSV